MRQDKGQVRHRRDRLDLNNPPTSVGGIQVTSRQVCRLDLNNPPTSVGGISVRLTMVCLNLAHMNSRWWDYDTTEF
jgi:hypothetical protein